MFQAGLITLQEAPKIQEAPKKKITKRSKKTSQKKPDIVKEEDKNKDEDDVDTSDIRERPLPKRMLLECKKKKRKA